MKYLKLQGLKGAFWMGLLRVVIKSFSFVKLVIAARLFSPFELGLFGIVLLPYGLIEVATESGINQALVQTKKDINNYFSSAWLAFIGRGLLLFAVLYFAAPYISAFYQSDLTLLIRIVAITPLLKGFSNPAVINFRKSLLFKKEFTYQSLVSISESVATIILMLTTKSILALPIGVAIGGLAATIFSFILTRFTWQKPSLAKIKDLYGYGRYVTIGTLLAYLNDQGDDFIVSKALGATPLGLYQTAYKISNLPTTQGAGLVYQVIFPIFSAIQTETKRLKRGLVLALLGTLAFSLSFALAMFVLAPFLTEIFLGTNWLPMVPALRVLLIFGISRPLISVGSALFDALGKPVVPAQMNLIKLAVLSVLVFPLTKSMGIVGTAWSVVIAQLAVYPWFVGKLKAALK